MGIKFHPWLLWSGGLLILSGALGCVPYYVVDGSGQAVTIADSTIEQDTLWQGTIIVDGVVKVAQGTTLRIAPGTRVEFTYRDSNRDGTGESGIYVNGRLIAEGTKQQNIVFTSHSGKPSPASWGEIIIEGIPPLIRT